MSVKFFLFSYLALISIEDIKSLKIKNTALFGMFVTCFCFSISSVSESILCCLLNSILFFCIFYLISKITKGLGSGDVKLVGVIAYFTEFFKMIFCLLFASIAGILFIILRSFKNTANIKIPFAPFITVGLLVSEFTFRLAV